jgi:hypothetical protein
MQFVIYSVYVGCSPKNLRGLNSIHLPPLNTHDAELGP